jgi:signal transduction histidine kinase/uncharacterized protein YoaH (UPF0181 family)
VSQDAVSSPAGAGTELAGTPEENLAEWQAALRRIATLVARGAPSAELFNAVAAGVGRVLPVVDLAYIGRYDVDRTVEFVGAWARDGTPGLVGERVGIGGENAATLVFRTNAPARVARLTDDAAATELARKVGSRSSAGAPITVGGHLWGVMTVGSSREEGVPAGLEARLADFTELVAAAIAHTQVREELRTIANEQTAVRHIATLVAEAAPPEAVFAAVAEEVRQVLLADEAFVGRYDPGPSLTCVGSARDEDISVPVRTLQLGGRNVWTIVYQTGFPARLDTSADTSDAPAVRFRPMGAATSVGVPVRVAGRLWGVVIATSDKTSLPTRTEQRLAAFTELLATAIANAETRQELRTMADEQAALRRVATLVAQGARPPEVFAASTDEVSRLLGADITWLRRYLPGPAATLVAAFAAGELVPPEEPRPLGGHNLATLVYETRRPARVQGSDWPLHDREGRYWPMACGVGVPVTVEGSVWGVMSVASSTDAPLPPGTEGRLTAFTELIATAIANAEAHDQLAASRGRVVASADEARRRIERDLHDGAQQRFVSLALNLRALRQSLPADQEKLADALDRIGTGLSDAIDELRELARGIHPAVLTEAGLAAALRALVRRCGVPIELDVRVTDRLPPGVEFTAYYVVSEALANATKHAKATVVHVVVDATGDVARIALRDDGVGGADPRRGSGLVGLRDRVEAVGGTMSLHSPVGEGTQLIVELPLRSLPASD